MRVNTHIIIWRNRTWKYTVTHAAVQRGYIIMCSFLIIQNPPSRTTHTASTALPHYTVQWNKPASIYRFFFFSKYTHTSIAALWWKGIDKQVPQAIINAGLCTPDNEKYTRPAADTHTRARKKITKKKKMLKRVEN